MVIADQILEQQIISSAIIFPEVLSDVAWLDEEDFQFDTHRTIWSVIKDILKDGMKVDISLVHKKLSEKGHDVGKYLHVLYSDTFISKGFNYLSFAKGLREERIKQSISKQEDIKVIKELISEIERAYVTSSELHDFDKALTGFMRRLDDKNIEKMNTGFPRLDYILGGLNKGDLIVLSSRPSMGKTSFALWVAFRLAKEGKRVLFFNLEMSVDSLMAKILSAETQIDNMRFRDKEFTDKHASSILKKASDLLTLSPYFRIIDAGSITTAQVEEELKTGYDFVVIDQLTKVRPAVNRDRKDLEIADITFSIKEIAKQYKVPILLLHQTNRSVDRRVDQMPTLSDLRDSGAVEQDADVVLFLHRKAYYNNDENDNRMIVKIAKNKMGMTGIVGFRFVKEFSTIHEVSKQDQMSEFSDYIDK